MKKNWYAVYTKQHCELKVAALLTRKKIDSFCPLNRVTNYSGNRRKLFYQPLFPSFVFVYTTEAEMRYIRQTTDVINFIYWLGKPAVIKDAEVKGLKHFTNNHTNIALEKIDVNVHTFIRTVNEQSSYATDTLPVNNIKLSLPSLGYMLSANTDSEAELYNYNYEGNKMVS